MESTLKGVGLDDASAKAIAKILRDNDINESNIDMIDRQTLSDIGVKSIGHQMSILKINKTPTPSQQPRASVGVAAAKAPCLRTEMTPQQFRKFLIDWKVFVEITNLPPDKHHAQLYSSADEEAQTALITTFPDFFSLQTSDLMDSIEKVVTRKANPLVHRVAFASMCQGDNESIQQYVIRLRASAKDCNFACPACHTDIADQYIKDQFVCGISNKTLQTDILAKAQLLDNVESVIKHAEAFETALTDQHKLANSAEIAAARASQYRQSKMGTNRQNNKINNNKINNRQNYQSQKQSQQTCAGCGDVHTMPYRRQDVCPAWGKKCAKCGLVGHFARVCRNDSARHIQVSDDTHESDASMSALIAHVSFDKNGKISECYDRDIIEIDAIVRPFSTIPETRRACNIPDNASTKLKIFPDSGASICLGGVKHLSSLGLSVNNLVPCKKVVTAVGNHRMICMGYLPVEFSVNGQCTKQAVYICNNIERLYFSKKACIDVGLLDKNFPNSPIPPIVAAATENHGIDKKVVENLPVRPQQIPYPPTIENVPKLKEWLLKAFETTAFNKINKDGKFPFLLAGPPAHIHLKEGAIPKARHNPIPVPFHMKKAVKQAIDEDVKKGIICPVPLGTPTKWCSTMVVQPKKDGRPRRTVDYQHLNSQCMRETHHQQSPFNLAMQVPAGAYKTVLDAVDGYHSVMIDEESQPLTTFITEWGRYMYTRMPQGFLASGDAYTSRYDSIISDVPRKVKIVDDVLLYDNNIHDAFYHTFDFLTLGHMNGIVFNIPKFVFCELETEFAGLSMTAEGVAPSKSMLSAITDFPTPATLTDARSWFGLINQVAWAYSLGSVMQPFRDLIKAKSEFIWNDALQQAFNESKKVIINLVKKGVTTFDLKRVTCLAPDWSKEGMGFLLLQKYCPCTLDKAPVCCPEGWRLIFAGSRFCNDAETRYAPIEGEAAAIAWSLDKCRMFVTDCPNLIITTDHRPLLGILGDRDLSKITNPRLLKLKEKTMAYRFSIQHCPGKWHRGSDAMSRNISAATKAIFEVCAVHPTIKEEEISVEVQSSFKAASIEAISDYGDHTGVISPDMIRASGRGDAAYSCLVEQISKGFPQSRHLTDPLIREFWEVRHRLSADDGLVMLDKRLVIPKGFRKRVLRCLHAAHQGVVGMKSRANETVYWPGMDACIRNHRESCGTCMKIAPSQPREPIILAKSPEWPFQQLAMDLFYVEDHGYLVYADRFTGWLMIYHLPPGKSDAMQLISITRGIFQAYGVPEEISRDGGPPMHSHQFLEFLKNWQVQHRVSSVGYAQSNGRAELAVKTAKRIVYDNAAPNGSLNTDKVVAAVLQYRNTPIQGIGLSPAQLLLHRHLRDCIPAHPSLYKPHAEWVTAAHQREELLARRNEKLKTEYNRRTHLLPPLSIGDLVIIQDQQSKRWKKSGVVVETLPYRQYTIRMDGSGRTTLRNRRFLKKIINVKPQIIPSPVVIMDPKADPFIPTTPQANQTTDEIMITPPGSPSPKQLVIAPKVPRALACLKDFNKRGAKE